MKKPNRANLSPEQIRAIQAIYTDSFHPPLRHLQNYFESRYGYRSGPDILQNALVKLCRKVKKPRKNFVPTVGDLQYAASLVIRTGRWGAIDQEYRPNRRVSGDEIPEHFTGACESSNPVFVAASLAEIESRLPEFYRRLCRSLTPGERDLLDKLRFLGRAFGLTGPLTEFRYLHAAICGDAELACCAPAELKPLLAELAKVTIGNLDVILHRLRKKWRSAVAELAAGYAALEQ